MSAQLEAVYDWMIANNKQLYIGGRKRINPKAKVKIELKESFVTIDEIMNMLDHMQAGSKSSFAGYLVEAEMFKNIKEALGTLRSYQYRKPNSATFTIRQSISDLFQEWRYEHGNRIRKRKKEMVLQEYNAKLQRYWRSHEAS